MNLEEFIAKHWRGCLWIWWPQAVAAVMAGFLFHRLGSCTHCFFGLISDESFLNFKNNSKHDGSVMYVTAEFYVCMASAALVIFLSNWRFLKEIPIQAIEQAAVGGQIHQRVSKYHETAFNLSIVSLILTLLWVIKLVWAIKFRWFGFADEVIALVIFVLFCAIDILFLVSSYTTIQRAKNMADLPLGRENREREIKSLDLTFHLFHDSLWYVDVPVVLGVSIVLLLSFFSENNFASLGLTPEGVIAFGKDFTLQQQRSVLGIFIVGISSGATVTHLVVSQFIFGILRTRDLYRRYK
jgi:hypothetical protein